MIQFVNMHVDDFGADFGRDEKIRNFGWLSVDFLNLQKTTMSMHNPFR